MKIHGRLEKLTSSASNGAGNGNENVRRVPLCQKQRLSRPRDDLEKLRVFLTRRKIHFKTNISVCGEFLVSQSINLIKILQTWKRPALFFRFVQPSSLRLQCVQHMKDESNSNFRSTYPVRIRGQSQKPMEKFLSRTLWVYPSDKFANLMSTLIQYLSLHCC